MRRATEPTEFPLHLCEVLEEELRELQVPPLEHEPGAEKAPKPAAENGAHRERHSWDFAPCQIREKGVPTLLARLRDPKDPVGRVLRPVLSPDFNTLLDGAEEKPPPSGWRQCLADELNLVLRQETDKPIAADLAKAYTAGGGCLRSEMELLLAACPSDRKRLLRLLLEEIFPAACEPIYELRLRAVRQRAHEEPYGLSALCLSGGGIRSAVYSLGVVQALAGRGLLGGFDYLSTVSGGGYLGGMLSAWMHRHPRGIEGVSAELSGPRPDLRTLQPEPAPLSYLRSYGNYLTPRLGILSADSWTLVSTYLRNLCLFWLVLIPLLLAALALPRLYLALCSISQSGALTVPFHLPAFGTVPPLHLIPEGLLALGMVSMVIGFSYIGRNRPSRGRRGSPRGFFVACLLPLSLGAIFLTLYWSVAHGAQGSWVPSWRLVVGVSVLMNVLSWMTYSIPRLLRREVSQGSFRELLIMVLTGFGGGLAAFTAIQVFGEPTASVDKLTEWTAFQAPWYTVFAVPVVLAAILFGETVFAGLTTRWTDDEDREWWARIAAWLLIVSCAWIVLCGIVLYGPVLLANFASILAPIGGLAGLATALLSRSSLTVEGQGGKRGKDWTSRLSETLLSLAAPIFVVVLGAAFSLGVSCLFERVLIVWFGFDPLKDPLSIRHLKVLSNTSWMIVLIFLGFTLALGLIMAMLIDINKFSLHAMYRNRLIRAFLGASRENRRPHAFTGFDSDDNLALSSLRRPLFVRPENLRRHGAVLCRRLFEGSIPPSSLVFEHYLSDATREGIRAFAAPGGAEEPPSRVLLRSLAEDVNRLIEEPFDEHLVRDLQLSEEEDESLRAARSDDKRRSLQRNLLLRAFPEIEMARTPKPLHVVNVALNLVAGKKLAWQQRLSEPFTFSPLHSGSARVGYRRSEIYAMGGASQRPITLGTAMAISGAAASPNMGYHSSPAITFLMTFFNARLGWWLGNPGIAGTDTFRAAQPKLGVSPLLSEALGLTDDGNPYVYLSDGGHFENLGLYEMVLRRCRYILVVDAGQDEGCRFEDLGNALRKIRIDLGIQVKLDSVPIWTELPAGQHGRYCAVGDILYSKVDGKVADGKLLYIKPVVYDNGEPKDVVHYKKLNGTFPHESTADQWFSESQFESYRALGEYALDAICGDRLKRKDANGGGDGKAEEMGNLAIQQLFEAARGYLLEGLQAAAEKGGGCAEPKAKPDGAVPCHDLGPAELKEPDPKGSERPPEARGDEP